MRYERAEPVDIIRIDVKFGIGVKFGSGEIL